MDLKVYALTPDEKLTALSKRLGVKADTAKKWDEKRPQLAAAEEAGEILIYGPIVDTIDAGWLTEWYGEDAVISAKIFKEKLNAIEGDVLVRLNSPGGDVWEASGIITAISERRAKGDKVNMIVDGLAASAASMVMIAGDEIKIAKLANIMIHECSALMYGTKKDFYDTAKFLESKDTEAVGLYKTRMKDMSDEEIMEKLEAETWYGPDEAVEAGLADEVVELDDKKKKASASADGDDDVDPMELLARRNMRLAALTPVAA